MIVGTQTHRDHGALKLRGIVKPGERRPYAEVDVYLDGRLIGTANASAFVAVGENATAPHAEPINRICATVAVRLARFMETAR